tara:strand:- start:52 stop:519 length:468 start_codon:yes stop_codon:yes gene_type:complete
VKHIKNCNRCDVLLTGDNWWLANYKKHDYICNSCSYLKRKTNRFKQLARTIGQAAWGSYDKVKQGHVYIVSNPAWKGWFKVGMAIDAADRCRGYQTSSPFRDFKLEYSRFFSDRKNTEKLVHKKLISTGSKNKGEWFNASLNEIKTTIKEVKDAT